MSSTKQRIRLTCAFAALAALALAVSCRGFFVNPTLTSLAIGPQTVPLAPGASYQMTATGTFSDGSTENVTSKSLWTSTNSSIASVGTTTGYVTAASGAVTVGSTTIGASDGAITATTTATITVCPTVSNLVITVTPNDSGPPGGPLTFDAKATVGSSSGVDVTTSVTWNVVDTSIVTITTSGQGTLGATAGSTTVTATLCNVNSTNVLTITVN